VFWSLSVFSLMRIISFSIRAILAGSDAAGRNVNLFIAEQTIYMAGFCWLLYAAYTLVFDRQLLAETTQMIRKAPGVPRTLFMLFGSRHFVRLVLLVSVGIGCAGDVETFLRFSSSSVSLGDVLRRASIYILLGMSILLILEITLLNLSKHAPEKSRMDTVGGGFGERHGVLVLFTISMLLVLRELFFTATATRLSDQNNEDLWYPFAAVTELLAVLLFAVPRLVPTREELPAESRGFLPIPLRTFVRSADAA